MSAATNLDGVISINATGARNDHFPRMQRPILRWWSQGPLCIQLFVLNSLFVLLNCYLTPNPYSAIHSGRAAQYSSVYSEEWFVKPMFGLLVCIFLVLCRYALRVRIYWLALSLITTECLSGVANGAILVYPQSYALDSLLLYFTAWLAHEDATHCAKPTWEPGFWRYACGLVTLGLILSAWRPETFGHFGDFSRDTRGEVTLLCAVGLFALLMPMGLQLGRTGRTSFHRVLGWTFVVMQFVLNLLVANRIYLISGVLAISACIYFLYNWKATTILAACGIVVLPNLSQWAHGYITAGEGYSVEMLTGRYDLWIAHWDAFVESPVLGSGMRLVDQLNYDVIATSEIGMLRWFSEFGVIHALGMTCLVLFGVISATRLLRRASKAPLNMLHWDIFCSLFVYFGLPIIASTGYTRILMFEDLAYYYVLFYCIYRSRVLASRGRMAAGAWNYLNAGARQLLILPAGDLRGLGRRVKRHPGPTT